MSLLIEFTKQPAEIITRAIDFKDKLPSATTLSSGVIFAIDSVGNDATNLVLSSSIVTISSTQAIFTTQAGVDKENYFFQLLVTLNDGQVLEEDLLMRVREV